MGRYGPHYSQTSVAPSVSDDPDGGWADTAHTTEEIQGDEGEHRTALSLPLVLTLVDPFENGKSRFLGV